MFMTLNFELDDQYNTYIKRKGFLLVIEESSSAAVIAWHCFTTICALSWRGFGTPRCAGLTSSAARCG